MIRKYLVLILVLGFLDLTFSSSGLCEDGFLFNPKRRRCEPQPPIQASPNCRPGTHWIPEKKFCIKFRQVISGYYPVKPEESTENLKCPKGFVSMGIMCVKELNNKKPSSVELKDGLELDLNDDFKIVIKDKKPTTPK
ncbi:uncharacterized protein LOC26526006 [Drosophila erecta]|uniref:Uncharacterized protein n=1 Tax=Drosophila erecta TaxID=7220 RepID=A0A0Q5VWJ6_DROER|nr:uncharacterized protein LOC26526006 [Drosophila erecta]KQS62571.1 uncharacterized protein Dere_GG26182 [Drosophila erecta]